MFPRLLPALMAGLFVGLAAGQAHAGLFDDEEARLRGENEAVIGCFVLIGI